MQDRMKPFPTGKMTNLLPPIDSYTYRQTTPYIYFKDSDRHPFEFDATDFRLVNAWWLADAAMLAYSDPSIVEDWCKKAGFERVEWFSGKTTQCFVAIRKEYVFVVFRGTRAPGKGQDISNVITDWRVDLHVRLVGFPQRGGSIHEGFRDALAEVWDTGSGSSGASLHEFLQTIVKDNPEATVWFTGHSLGAALATVAACLWGSPKGLYTFGSPMVGDRAFQRSSHLRAWRVVNNTDVITRLPKFGLHRPLKFPIFFGRYRPVGELKFIDADGNIVPSEVRPRVRRFLGPVRYLRLKMGWAFEKLADHAPLRYTIRIWNEYVRVSEGRPATGLTYSNWFGRASRFVLAWGILLTLIVAAVVGVFGAWVAWNLFDTPRAPRAANPTFVQTGLTDADRNKFYHASEGSEVFPLLFAMSAKVGEKKQPFLENLERYGFIADTNHKADSDEPSYIGLTINPRPGLGEFKLIGVNCAACHVGQIEYRGETFRIDGAPNMLDPVSFLSDLRHSIDGVGHEVLPLYSRAVWAIFTSSLTGRNMFRDITSSTVNTYFKQLVGGGDLVSEPEPLAGRADAFGTARALFFGDNRRLSAPASFPHIWGLQQTAWFHWVANTNSVIERNFGQALGLGAGIDIHHNCDTSINYSSLQLLERLASKIVPPVWPEKLGEIGPNWTKGMEVYLKKCAGCHDNYKTYTNGVTELQDYRLSSLNEVGTDENEARNSGPDVMLDPNLCDDNGGIPPKTTSFGKAHDILPTKTSFADAHEKLLGGVNMSTFDEPQFPPTITDKILDFLRIKIPPPDKPKVSLVELPEHKLTQLNGVRPTPKWIMRINCEEREKNDCPVYPAKPLTGIWATAPYLHNGSVPTIADLLKPEDQRPKSFYVGQREYDPEHLGYVQPPQSYDFNQPNVNVFLTELVGNLNKGHSGPKFGTDLSDDDKKALIEFLKSLTTYIELQIHRETMMIENGKAAGQKSHYGNDYLVEERKAAEHKRQYGND